MKRMTAAKYREVKERKKERKKERERERERKREIHLFKWNVEK